MEFTYEGAVRWSFGFHNPNHAAAAICAILPFLWGWRRRAWIGWMLVPPLFVALALTYSRTGFVVAALEIVAWAGLAWKRGARSSADGALRTTRPAMCLAVLLGLLLIAAVLGGVAGRLAPDGAALNRPLIWWAGLKIAAANPWGVGLGNSGLLASTFLLDGIECRTLVNSHLTLLVEFGWIAGCVWIAFLAFALARGMRLMRTWCAFAGLCVSSFTSSVFDWHVLFDWSDMGGLDVVNFMLSWMLLAAFLAMGVRLAVGRRCDGDVVCVVRQPCRMEQRVGITTIFRRGTGILSSVAILVLLQAALLSIPKENVPKVRGGFVVKEGRDMPLVLHGEEWTLKSVVEYLSAPDGGMPDGYKLAIISGFVPPDTFPASAWLFGTVAESAHRLSGMPITAVSPPEFCALPPDARVVK